jgi:NAD(P)-dependent dehydrogenase (short-subunit alcohol dehydrogenase family)
MSATKPLEGKTVVVTGASAGIGKSTAIGVAKAGAHVVLVVRDQARGEEAKKEIAEKSGSSSLEVMLCDFSRLQSIREFAAEYQKKHDRLHVLINNAGAVNTTRKLTHDGFEQTFGVNHLGYFLVTELLLPVIKASAPARIINVSSAAHNGQTLDFDDLQSEKRYSTFEVYGRSKLCNLYFTFELARRLAGSGVTVNALHPGVVSTQFGQNNGGVLAFAIRIARPFFLSADDGAKTSVYLATSPDVEGVTGKYFDKCKEKRPSRQSQDDVAARRLWEVSEKLVAQA